MKLLRIRKRREIIVETTQQILVSKSEAGNVVWCPVCAENVAAVTSEEAALMIGVTSQSLQIHLVDGSEGLPLVCLKSLSAFKHEGGDRQ